MPSNKEIRYRYLICSVDPQTEEIHVRQWETHIEPRAVPYNKVEGADECEMDVYGDVKGEIKLDRGWLTSETIVQFKFFNNPFMLKERIKNKLLYVKVCDDFFKFFKEILRFLNFRSLLLTSSTLKIHLFNWTTQFLMIRETIRQINQ